MKIYGIYEKSSQSNHLLGHFTSYEEAYRQMMDNFAERTKVNPQLEKQEIIEYDSDIYGVQEGVTMVEQINF